VIKKFEYNPQNKICRRSFIFLTKTGPIIFSGIILISIIVSIIEFWGFLVFTIIFGFALAGIGKKYLAKSIIIDLERKTMTVSTFDDLIYESTLGEVKFQGGGTYSGTLVSSIKLGKKYFEYFEVLEGEDELKDLIFANCKDRNLIKRKKRIN
jgi:hypothetical protein